MGKDFQGGWGQVGCYGKRGYLEGKWIEYLDLRIYYYCLIVVVINWLIVK